MFHLLAIDNVHKHKTEAEMPQTNISNSVQTVADQRAYSGYKFGKNENDEAAKNANQKKAYKFFAVH
jgi:hypothetical protein